MLRDCVSKVEQEASMSVTGDNQASKEYLTTLAIAKQLDVSEQTVRNWIKSGELEGYLFGRRAYRVPRRAFESYLQAHKITAINVHK